MLHQNKWQFICHRIWSKVTLILSQCLMNVYIHMVDLCKTIPVINDILAKSRRHIPYMSQCFIIYLLYSTEHSCPDLEGEPWAQNPHPNPSPGK